MPRYQLRKRLKEYVEHLTDEMDDQSIALFACATKADLIYVKRRIRLLNDNSEKLPIRVATVESIKQQGITAKIWEEV